MRKHFLERRSWLFASLIFSTLLVGAGVLMGVGVGTANAMPAKHTKIYLRGPDGEPITKWVMKGDDATIPNAFSAKATCGWCHNGSDREYANPAEFRSGGPPTGTALGATLRSYDEIERHGYHFQLGANHLKGWNCGMPPSYGGSGSWVSHVSMAKPWVQGQGHVGKW